jgi:hypothetical protein
MSDSSTLQSWINIFMSLGKIDFDIICEAVEVVKEIKNARKKVL